MERHIFIEDVQPAIGAGRYPIKRVVGEPWEVRATIFRDGADIIRAVLQVQGNDQADSREFPMTVLNPGLDLWRGELKAEQVGRFCYSVVARTDTYATWVREMDRKITAGRRELGGEIAEGRAIFVDALGNATKADQSLIESTLELVKPETNSLDLLQVISRPEVMAVMLRSQARGSSGFRATARSLGRTSQSTLLHLV